jgi:hypothetical protein
VFDESEERPTQRTLPVYIVRRGFTLRLVDYLRITLGFRHRWSGGG